MYAWQAGGSLVGDDGKWNLNTPQMVDALQYNAAFFTAGTADTAGPTFLDAQPYFVSGKTASMITGPWVIGQLDTAARDRGPPRMSPPPRCPPEGRAASPSPRAAPGASSPGAATRTPPGSSSGIWPSRAPRSRSTRRTAHCPRSSPPGTTRPSRAGRSWTPSSPSSRTPGRSRRSAPGSRWRPGWARRWRPSRRARRARRRRPRTSRRTPRASAPVRSDGHDSRQGAADTAAAPKPASPRRSRARRTAVAWLFLTPFALVFLVYTAIPTVAALALSLTDIRGADLRTPFAVDFTGVDNYLRLFQDDTSYGTSSTRPSSWPSAYP